VRRHARDDHEGPEAHPRDRGRARRGRAGSGGRHRLLNTTEVFDRAAATYDVAAFPFFTPFGEALVEFANLEPGARVLDVGCGTGAALLPASRIASRAVGIELSPAMAARAREAVPAAEVVVGDASQLPFADGEFDVVLSSFTVFFMPDPSAALREWARVLAPGGRIVTATWGSADPRWGWERDVRMEFLSELEPEVLQEIGGSLARISRFDDPSKVADEFRAAAMTPGDVAQHTIEFRFADEQAWLDWNWSHGTRVFLEALPNDARERFRDRAFEAMQHLREANGFPRTYTAIFAEASRAD
jgi:ubiquinone/menaquinone biosynthesis C-methylase UbiE